MSAILTCIADVRLLPIISLLAHGFPEAMKNTAVWRNRVVRTSPQGMYLLAPNLKSWCCSWRLASKMVIPRSNQLITAISQQLPNMILDFAWRFDEHMKGDGVEVLNNGLSVRRTGDEHLVVLGDAPLLADTAGTGQYLEVVLDIRGELLGDGLNDFGLGFTACDPTHMLQDDLGEVADDVPHCWVVDFTSYSVVLNVNNYVTACGTKISGATLKEGDRVGIRAAADGAIEVYLNGALCQRLVPPQADRPPVGVALYPVLDLYGRSVQITRTKNDMP